MARETGILAWQTPAFLVSLLLVVAALIVVVGLFLFLLVAVQVVDAQLVWLLAAWPAAVAAPAAEAASSARVAAVVVASSAQASASTRRGASASTGLGSLPRRLPALPLEVAYLVAVVAATLLLHSGRPLASH